MRRIEPLRSPRPLLALAVPALLLAACFEEPVREELELRFGTASDADRVEVALGVSFLADEERIESYALRNRLEGERHRLIQGVDDWVPRFDRMAPLSHEVTYERDHGVLVGVTHTALVDLAEDPDALRRFFSDTLVNAFFEAREEQAELSLVPLAPGRASRRQRQRLERVLDPWTGAVEGYFRATARLYEYLDRHPDRAEICLSVVMEEVLPEEDGGRRPLLLPAEEGLVEAVEEAMSAALEILVIDSQEAYSINEISRLAYDPFPAVVRVVPAGPAVEVEGFEDDGEGGLRVPRVSLWDALRSLRGRWLEPDLLVLYVDQSGGVAGEARGDRFDLEGLLAHERVHGPPPSAAELRTALDERLVPAPIYRVAWARGAAVH